MLTLTSKNTNRRRVHERIRKKVLGTSERPRLNVYRSLNHIYVQVIDDLEGKTLVSANSAEGTKESRTSGRGKDRRKNNCRTGEGQRYQPGGIRPWRLHLSRPGEGAG